MAPTRHQSVSTSMLLYAIFLDYIVPLIYFFSGGALVYGSTLLYASTDPHVQSPFYVVLSLGGKAFGALGLFKGAVLFFLPAACRD